MFFQGRTQLINGLSLRCRGTGAMQRERRQHSHGRVCCAARDGIVCTLAASEL